MYIPLDQRQQVPDHYLTSSASEVRRYVARICDASCVRDAVALAFPRVKAVLNVKLLWRMTQALKRLKWLQRQWKLVSRL